MGERKRFLHCGKQHYTSLDMELYKETFSIYKEGHLLVPEYTQMEPSTTSENGWSQLDDRLVGGDAEIAETFQGRPVDVL